MTWSDKTRLAALFFSALGLAIAAYLTWIHYARLEAVCVGGGGGCERVQSSDYATLLGVPVAVWGLAGYILIGASLVFKKVWWAFSLSVVGFAFSAYLTYLELFVINAICQWCVASAVCMSGLAVMTTLLVVRDESEPS